MAEIFPTSCNKRITLERLFLEKLLFSREKRKTAVIRLREGVRLVHQLGWYRGRIYSFRPLQRQGAKAFLSFTPHLKVYWKREPILDKWIFISSN